MTTKKTKALLDAGHKQLEELTAKPKPVNPYTRLKEQYDQVLNDIKLRDETVEQMRQEAEALARRNQATTTALDVANLLLRNETTKREVVEGRIDSVRPYLDMAVNSPFLKMLFPKHAVAIRNLYNWWTTSRLDFYKSSDETTHDFVKQMVDIGNAKHPGIDADLAVLGKDLPVGKIAGLRDTTKNAATPNPYNTAPYHKR